MASSQSDIFGILLPVRRESELKPARKAGTRQADGQAHENQVLIWKLQGQYFAYTAE
jgi:hypothetical protein